MITEPTYKAAADTAGISEATLYRWLKDEPFRKAYREAASQAFEGAIRKLHALTPRALEILSEYLEGDEPHSKKVRWVFALLDRGYRGKEQMELIGRLEALEEALEHRGRA